MHIALALQTCTQAGEGWRFEPAEKECKLKRAITCYDGIRRLHKRHCYTLMPLPDDPNLLMLFPSPERLLTDCTQQHVLTTNAHQSLPLFMGPFAVRRHLVPAPHPAHATQPNLDAPFPYAHSSNTVQNQPPLQLL